MKRRNFLKMGSFLTLSSYVEAKREPFEHYNTFVKEFKEVEKLIVAVQEHMFPHDCKIPSAKEMNTGKFLFEAISHSCYDKDTRAFVLAGAKEFKSSMKEDFLLMSEIQKENALRSYEKSSYGQNWLSRIMILTLEGIFSDPIYGSNKNEAGWKAVNSYGGFPRAKSRYIEL